MAKQSTKLKNLKRFLQENYPNIQAFNVLDIFGDKKELVYDQDGIRVLYCKYYEYIEIYGLTDEEFDSLVTLKYGFAHCLKTFRLVKEA